MVTAQDFALIDPSTSEWPGQVEALRRGLGAPDNPHLFPPHFLQAIFPKLGGMTVRWPASGEWIMLGFLFPRGLVGTHRVFTMRIQARSGYQDWDPSAQLRAAQAVAAGLANSVILPYDPRGRHRFGPTAEPTGDLWYGRPNESRAAQMRDLQALVWGVDHDYLYPADIHSLDFGAGTSLVAWQGEALAGALFGFYQFSSEPLPEPWQRTYRCAFRIESQSLGVDPAFRGRDIGFHLKALQAREALGRGIDMVNWVTDPLQYPNARLNFGRLRGVCGAFFPDYLPFRNRLNRLPASRLRITWPIRSAPVQRALAGADSPGEVALDEVPENITWVNQGWEAPIFHATTPRIALEIPANWTQLQDREPELALRWRETTDRLLAHYLGWQDGRYVITGVGSLRGHHYLLAEKAHVALFQEYLPAHP